MWLGKPPPGLLSAAECVLSPRTGDQSVHQPQALKQGGAQCLEEGASAKAGL